MKTSSRESLSDILDAPPGHTHDFWDDADDLPDIKQLGNDWFCVRRTHYRFFLFVYFSVYFVSLFFFLLLTIISTQAKSSIKLKYHPELTLLFTYNNLRTGTSVC